MSTKLKAVIDELLKDEEVLKPCPLCGSDAAIVSPADGYVYWWICCAGDAIKCGFEGGLFGTKQSAIDAWNRRPAPQWSTEPPTEPGWYWFFVGRKRYMANIFPPERIVFTLATVHESPCFIVYDLKDFCIVYTDVKWLKIEEPE